MSFFSMALFRVMSKLTLEYVKSLSASFGVECISTHYSGRRGKLKFRCLEGHEFERSLDSATAAKQWCTKCSRNISEELCRFILEKSFNVKFDKFRTKYEGRILELDGYNKELEIAFEYNGKQHYQKTAIVRTDKALQDRFFLDALKVKYCRENSIKLLVIPHTVLNDDMKSHIGREMNIDTSNVDVDMFTKTYSHYRRRREEMSEIITNKGGQMTSFGLDRVGIRCSKGHEWVTQCGIIRKGSWCRKCADQSPFRKNGSEINVHLYDAYVETCKKFDVRILTPKSEYAGHNTIMKFCCGHGHEFHDNISNVMMRISDRSEKRRRKICPKCNTHRLDLVLQLVEKHGLKLVSPESYTNKNQEQQWICKNSHIQIGKLANLSRKAKCGTPLCFCLERLAPKPKRKQRKQISSF